MTSLSSFSLERDLINASLSAWQALMRFLIFRFDSSRSGSVMVLGIVEVRILGGLWLG